MRQSHFQFLSHLNEKVEKIEFIENDWSEFSKNIRLFLLGHTNLAGVQALLGYESLFRGVIAKNWFQVGGMSEKYRHANKIIVKECVLYYGKLWMKRNERRNSEVIRRRRLLDWAKCEVDSIENYRHVNVAQFIETTYERVQRMSADAIQRWLCQLHTLRKKNKVTQNSDIRSFFMPG